MNGPEPARVLLIEPSALFGRILAKELDARPSVRVVAKACDAVEARQQILLHHPDVIVLALELRQDDALHLLRTLVSHYPVPVIMYSALSPRSGPRALKAIQMGALDFVTRPSRATQETLGPMASELAEKIRMATAQARPAASRRLALQLETPSFSASGLTPARYLVVVGASTGGTEAVRALLAAAPADFPGVVVVQHMPAGFTRSFAERLNQFSPLHVSEGREGDLVVPGRAFVARGDTHLVVRRAGEAWRIHYTHQDLVNRHCPSVDVLFESAASAGASAVGVLLTGMGDDGARGLLSMSRRQALTIAQDPLSCVVYGMPKVAVGLGAAQCQARPEEVPGLVRRVLAARRSGTAPRCTNA